MLSCFHGASMSFEIPTMPSKFENYKNASFNFVNNIQTNVKQKDFTSVLYID